MLHPDYLLQMITWEQFQGWMRYSEVEPWGEERTDQRTFALAAWIKSPIQWGAELPELIYPYFPGQDSDAILAQKVLLDKMKQEYLEKHATAQSEQDTP